MSQQQILSSNRMGRRARSRDGMTLVEIMIVVIIMALIAAAVGVAVLPRLQKARIESTKADAQAIRSAVVLWLGDHPGGDCPAVDDLVKDGILDKSKRRKDAWDHDFEIECNGDDIAVASAGPDGQMGSDDDIQ